MPYVSVKTQDVTSLRSVSRAPSTGRITYFYYICGTSRYNENQEVYKIKLRLLKFKVIKLKGCIFEQALSEMNVCATLWYKKQLKEEDRKSRPFTTSISFLGF